MKFVKKVLIIDDEEEFLNSFAELLREEFNVDTANNFDFIKKIKKNHYDLIVLDILMDGKDGDLVYAEIKNIDKRCKIVVLTHLTKANKKRRSFEKINIPVFSKMEEDLSEKVIAYISSLRNIGDLYALIVDDQKVNRNNFAEMLEIIGVKNIDIFSTIGKAKKGINEKINKKEKYDIYLIDICFKKRREEEPIGGELIEFLKKKGLVKNSVIIPMTCKDVGKKKLDNVENVKNIHPIFYDAIEDLKERLESIFSISPFLSVK